MSISTKIRHFFYKKIHCIKEFFQSTKEIISLPMFIFFILIIVYVVTGELLIEKYQSIILFRSYTVLGALLLIGWFLTLLTTIKKISSLNSKEMKDKLSYKITSIISANIDHQLQTPLLSLSSSFDDLQKKINKITRLAKHNGNRVLDKMVYGCNEQDPKICMNCSLKSNCQRNKDFIQDYINNAKNIKFAIKNIQETLTILKGSRETKERAPSTLYEVINDAVMTYRMLNKNKIHFNISPEFKDYKINSDDAPSLLNVFANHINNSIDAHAFVINFIFKGYQEGKVILHIVDDGDGIPPDQLENVWTYKTSSKGKNRGFGMFLCKHLITAMGGDEEIVFSSNEGTVLKITVPSVPSKVDNE